MSTEEQTLDNQRADIKRALRVRRLRQVASFEEHVSAAKARPEFDAMMEAAHRGEFEVIIVWALDRFGRSMVGNLQAVLDLDRCGVEVISVNESWLCNSSRYLVDFVSQSARDFRCCQGAGTVARTRLRRPSGALATAPTPWRCAGRCPDGEDGVTTRA